MNIWPENYDCLFVSCKFWKWIFLNISLILVANFVQCHKFKSNIDSRYLERTCSVHIFLLFYRILVTEQIASSIQHLSFQFRSWTSLYNKTTRGRRFRRVGRSFWHVHIFYQLVVSSSVIHWWLQLFVRWSLFRFPISNNRVVSSATITLFEYSLSYTLQQVSI